MALELRQQLKLSQQLVMTPQLQQAIKLLQLSRLELMDTVHQEMLENPFLEEATNDDTFESVQDDRRDVSGEAYDNELAKDASWEDYLGEFASTPKASQNHEFESSEELSPFEGRYASKPTLEGHLLWQLRLSTLSEEEKDIGEIIIGNLSSAGYLAAGIDEIAEIAKSTPEKVQKVLAHIQNFDPVGIAARDARECLLIQIKNLNYDRDPVLAELIQSHLEDLEAKRYKPLLRKFKMEMEDLREYLDIIKSLDPMPGSSFGGGEPTYVSPDVFVYKNGDEFVILLNEEGLPQLQLSSLAEMNIDKVSEEEKEYCNEKMRSATWLIKSLYQRQRTLYKEIGRAHV